MYQRTILAAGPTLQLILSSVKTRENKGVSLTPTPCLLFPFGVLISFYYLINLWSVLILENEIYQDNDINEIDFRKNSRELILSKLEDAIEYLHKKSLKGHIQNKENEKVRIQWFKALSHACSIYNQISRDSDLDDLRKEFDDFKKMMK